MCLQLSPDWYGDVFDYLKDWEKEIDSHPEHPIYHCNYEVTKQVPFPSKRLRLPGCKLSERERETDRQTDRQADRQRQGDRDRQTDRQKQRQRGGI